MIRRTFLSAMFVSLISASAIARAVKRPAIFVTRVNERYHEIKGDRACVRMFLLQYQQELWPAYVLDPVWANRIPEQVEELLQILEEKKGIWVFTGDRLCREAFYRTALAFQVQLVGEEAI